MPRLNYYFLEYYKERTPVNKWDVLALVLIFGVMALIAMAAKQMTTAYHVGETIAISLDPANLPAYALRSVVRMLIALVFSLLFTFTVGTLAAKSKLAERIIIPAIDILQSIPVLGYLSITVTVFIAAFRGSILGPECAAIFAIFTAQVWNMTLGFYQNLRTLPIEYREAAKVFHLSGWQKFWRIEVPFSMPGLLWNMMMSMSASWFFVVASEAISIAGKQFMLPGVGSYIALAISQANITAVVYAILTMFIVILLYDQLLFRPLVTWSEKFRAEVTASEQEPKSWVIDILQRTRALQYVADFYAVLVDYFVNTPWRAKKINAKPPIGKQSIYQSIALLLKIGLIMSILIGIASLVRFVYTSVSWPEVRHVLLLGLYTGVRIFLLIIVCSLLWIPIGVWIGLRPRLAQFIQPIVQFLAAFPANLFFPVFVMVIIKYHLNAEIWLTPLIILGTQWYILFNVIAGTSVIPKELHHAAANLGVTGWLWWRRVALPGILPYFVTGAITAAGGAWNASILAEVVSWGDVTLRATGLGAYITEQTAVSDFPRVALGIGIMCLYVLVLNRLVWQPLYNLIEARYKLD